ncbi:MAG: ABC transporter ATP-binding protein [Armatimonadetes bacterium]|nr:ABC transporter ATP-binding protein [Armatimonadota bacterium]
MADPLLEVQGLTTEFTASGQVIHAVRGVSFRVDRGEVVGIVGESGCGKSVTALSVMRLVPNPPGRIVAGSVRLGGLELTSLGRSEMARIRGGRMSMIFQDPFSALNPTMTLGAQITESLLAHRPTPKAQAREEALALLRSVQIPSPEMRFRQYPHEVSGGQRQRVMIAMAFSSQPELVIADEPTTALDVTVQAQILNLMDEFRRRAGSAVLLITHDFGIVAETCDRVLVMYAGQIVEEAPTAAIISRPRHPYTQALIRSLPRLEGASGGRLPTIAGRPPDLAHPPAGCAFADRCDRAEMRCRVTEPEWRSHSAGGVRCLLADLGETA